MYCIKEMLFCFVMEVAILSVAFERKGKGKQANGHESVLECVGHETKFQQMRTPEVECSHRFGGQIPIDIRVKKKG